MPVPQLPGVVWVDYSSRRAAQGRPRGGRGRAAAGVWDHPHSSRRSGCGPGGRGGDARSQPPASPACPPAAPRGSGAVGRGPDRPPVATRPYRYRPGSGTRPCAHRPRRMLRSGARFSPAGAALLALSDPAGRDDFPAGARRSTHGQGGGGGPGAALRLRPAALAQPRPGCAGTGEAGSVLRGASGGPGSAWLWALPEPPRPGQ